MECMEDEILHRLEEFFMPFAGACVKILRKSTMENIRFTTMWAEWKCVGEILKGNEQKM